MKRLASFLFLAALGGGCVTSDAAKNASSAKPFNHMSKGVAVPGVVGPTGEPVQMTKRPTADSGVVQASGTAPMTDANVTPAAGFSRIVGSSCADGACGSGNAHMPGLFNRGPAECASGHCGSGGGGGGGGFGHGIYPAPPMGPAGAVAAVGAIGAGSMMPIASNMRTSIRFVNPLGMKVTWLGQGGYSEPGLTVPTAYNFGQGNIYRLKLTGIPTLPGKVYYPTLEVAAATPKTITFLDHGTVPVSFTQEDLERVNTGNLVVKVIYLPDPQFQDVAAVAGAEEVVSTQLEPGTDPIVEANRRGTILAIIRIGNIDLENPNTPAKDAPPGMGMTGAGPMVGYAPPMTAGPMTGAPPTVTAAPRMMPGVPATTTSMIK